MSAPVDPKAAPDAAKKEEVPAPKAPAAPVEAPKAPPVIKVP